MKNMLRFMTCGSVDDGKSTLIGHMLYDAKLIFADQKRALELDSKIRTGGAVDYSLLLDGLQAEREQGITIDVAYRYFTTDNRRFIVADAPGHEEYTKNMAVGASFAELAVILIDASKGVLIQTKRHTRICSLMGIRDFIFAINKMDLVGYDEKTYRDICVQIDELTSDMPIHSLNVIPVSATAGDNLTASSENTPWYAGMPLLSLLESAEPYTLSDSDGFYLPVQRTSRPSSSFRGFQGEIISGTINNGDEITAYPSAEKAKVTRIISAGNDVTEAGTGEPVTLCLDREIDISRGCVISKNRKPYTEKNLKASVLWMSGTPLSENSTYILQLATQKTIARVSKIYHKADIETGEIRPASHAERNDVVLCEIEAGTPLVFTSFDDCKDLGELILVDRTTHETAACGVVREAVSESENIVAQSISITRQMRENKNGYKAMTLWMTGLSGSGKSTLADCVEKRLFSLGINSMILDGDNVRLGLCKGLGFSKEGRSENIRRVAEVSKLLNDAGTIVIAAFVSPFADDREMARSIIGNFAEVYVNAPLDECIRRDTKGFYKKAMNGEIKNFTGISDEYEEPVSPEIKVDTLNEDINRCTDRIMEYILKHIAL